MQLLLVDAFCCINRLRFSPPLGQCAVYGRTHLQSVGFPNAGRSEQESDGNTEPEEGTQVRQGLPEHAFDLQMRRSCPLGLSLSSPAVLHQTLTAQAQF